MYKVVLTVFVFLFSQMSFGAEVYSVNSGQTLEGMLADNCPWINASEVKQIMVKSPEMIGMTGGTVGNALGSLFKSTGVSINSLDVAANLPQNTRALLFSVAYYNNNKQAEVIFQELGVIDRQGKWLNVVINSDIKVLSQQTSETALICFTAGEDPIRVKAKVTHAHVDGSRPTIGIAAIEDVATPPVITTP